MSDQREQAYSDGKRAYSEGVGPLENPHTPAPPGDPLLAKLWRAGWQAARRAVVPENSGER
jgi:hypothetical protein